MLNFAICDDNINILDKLEKMLENIFTKNNFSFCYNNDNIINLLHLYNQNKYVKKCRHPMN